ncbi:MAG TPA: DUF507 family protein, partial [bacterium]|nr:DUF507 family protein [bacterium]
RVLRELKAKNLLVLKAEPEAIQAKIEQVMIANFQAEDKLDEEAKRLFDQFKSKLPPGGVNEQEALQKIRKQLAKDRKFVL